MGRAADLLLEKRQKSTSDSTIYGFEYNAQHMAAMRERLLANLIQGLEKEEEESGCESIVQTNGPKDPNQRLPNTLSVGLKGIRSGELLANIGNVVACSAGSACHSSSSGCQNSISSSSILKAMDVSPEYGIGTLRLSVGPDTTEKYVDDAAEIIVQEAKRQLGSA